MPARPDLDIHGRKSSAQSAAVKVSETPACPPHDALLPTWIAWIMGLWDRVDCGIVFREERRGPVTHHITASDCKPTFQYGIWWRDGPLEPDII